MSDERRRKQIERMVKAEVAAGLRMPWWRSVPKKILGFASFALALVAVWPSVSVTQGSQALVQTDPLTVPFTIKNDGFLSEKIDCIAFVHKFEAQRRHINNSLIHQPDWDNQHLDRGDPKTIVIAFADGLGIPDSAEVGIKVTYTTLGFIRRDKIFQFDGRYGDNWQWMGQPVSDKLRRDFEHELSAGGY